MDTKPQLKIPVKLLILDGIGALLLGLGFAEYFAELGLFKDIIPFPDYPIIMMILGVALMAPMMSFVIKFAVNQNKPQVRNPNIDP